MLRMGLVHLLIYTNHDDYVLLGIYATDEDAVAAKERAVTLKRSIIQGMIAVELSNLAILMKEFDMEDLEDAQWWVAHLKEAATNYPDRLSIVPFVVGEDCFEYI